MTLILTFDSFNGQNKYKERKNILYISCDLLFAMLTVSFGEREFCKFAGTSISIWGHIELQLYCWLDSPPLIWTNRIKYCQSIIRYNVEIGWLLWFSPPVCPANLEFIWATFPPSLIDPLSFNIVPLISTGKMSTRAPVKFTKMVTRKKPQQKEPITRYGSRYRLSVWLVPYKPFFLVSVIGLTKKLIDISVSVSVVKK